MKKKFIVLLSVAVASSYLMSASCFAGCYPDLTVCGKNLYLAKLNPNTQNCSNCLQSCSAAQSGCVENTCTFANNWFSACVSHCRNVASNKQNIKVK